MVTMKAFVKFPDVFRWVCGEMKMGYAERERGIRRRKEKGEGEWDITQAGRAAIAPSVQFRAAVGEDGDLGAGGFHGVQVDAHGEQRLGLAALDQCLAPRINHCG